MDYTKQKLAIFKELYNNEAKNAPYDTLTDEVKDFCSNVKSAYSNLRNGHIKYFEMKNKKTINGYSLFISKKSIQSKGIFINKLGPIKNFNINENEIKSDSRLIFNKLQNKYILNLTLQRPIKETVGRNKIVALDPGEKIFMA